MDTLTRQPATRSPDLLGRFRRPDPPRRRLEAPELVDAIGAVLDRQDIAGPDERGRLALIRGHLEAELADRLAE